MTYPPPPGQPDELSALDYLMYRGEAHPATRSAFLGVELLDRPADWGRLREAMDRASRVVVRMRQKVVVPPVPVTPPRWVVDPDFDLDYHLRRIALPAPGTLRMLLGLAEVTLASPLDTARPLWEVVYVEGLADGPGTRAALLSKFSHAITDGLGGIALFEQVYDTERDPAPRPMPPVPIPRDVTGADLLRDSLRQLPGTAPAAGARLAGRAAGNRITGVTIAAPALDILGRIAPVLSLLPDAALRAVTARITPPDIQASNVPGYWRETFLAGARVDRQYGLGPLPRVAMMAVLISRAGICTVTFRYDTASFTAPDQLEKGLRLGFEEVIGLGRPRPSRKRRTS